DLDARRLGGRKALEPLLASYGAPVNSDYYPYLDLNAPRLRFLKTEATEFSTLGAEHAVLVELLDRAQAPRTPSQAVGPDFQKTEEVRKARYAAAFLLSGVPPEPVNIPHGLQKDLELVHLKLVRCADTVAF